MRLSFENDAEVEQSTIFLRKSHPLNYTAAVKKSQVCRTPSCMACTPVRTCRAAHQLYTVCRPLNSPLSFCIHQNTGLVQ